MIKSMTGFGRSEYTDEKRTIIAEIRTVNHRYFDINVKMPRRYSFAEEAVKAEVKKVLARGKIDVNIIVDNATDGDLSIRLNTGVAAQYYEGLKALRADFPDLTGDISLKLLASMPDVLKAVPDVEDEEEITRAILKPVAEAAAKLDEMRAVEGAKLAEDILMRGQLIRDLTEKIKKRSPIMVAEYTQRLRERISELVDGAAEIPQDRILLEAAIFADKCSITEELVRLDSHTAQLAKIINSSNGADGKKLDFLVQEMNREANTIGSKSNDLEITNDMLQIKAEVEKIREQVQNIE